MRKETEECERPAEEAGPWVRLRRHNPDAFAALKGYEIASQEILGLAVRASLGETVEVAESALALERAGRAWVCQVLRSGRDLE